MTREEVVDGAPVTVFFGVFRLLEGEDKYTWVENRLTDKEYDSAARVLAQFHHSAFDFDPGDLAREQPPIMEFVPTLAGTFKECAAQATGTAFDDHFVGKLPAILDVIAKGVEVESQLSGLPVTPVHCDYHPGNLKWVDEQGVGSVRLRLVEARLPGLRRRPGRGVLLQFLGRAGQRRAAPRQGDYLRARVSGRGGAVV